MVRLSFLPLPQNERECSLSFQSLPTGMARADVATAMPVKFLATIQMPPDAGKVMNARWEFEGEKDFPIVQEIKPSDVQHSGALVTLTMTHTFAKPGTYFPALLVTSQRAQDANTPFARISNLGRVRVVVK